MYIPLVMVPMNVTDVESPASFKTPASDLDTFNFNWVTDVHASHRL